jgi:hypothetical protein
MTPVLPVRDMTDLQRSLAARADAIGLSREVIDQLSGLPSGYAAKLLSLAPAKGIGTLSVFLLAGAVGYSIALVEDPDALAKAKRYARQRQKLRQGVGHWRSAKAMALVRAIASRGGKSRFARMSPEELRAHQSRSAQARWRKWRRARRIAAQDQGGGTTEKPKWPESPHSALAQ